MCRSVGKELGQHIQVLVSSTVPNKQGVALNRKQRQQDQKIKLILGCVELLRPVLWSHLRRWGGPGGIILLVRALMFQKPQVLPRALCIIFVVQVMSSQLQLQHPCLLPAAIFTCHADSDPSGTIIQLNFSFCSCLGHCVFLY